MKPTRTKREAFVDIFLRTLAWWLFLVALVLILTSPVWAQTLTTVADTVYGPSGQLLSGTITISNNSTFTAADGTVVPVGTIATAEVTSGAFSIQLVPNAGSTPSGTSYQATYKLGTAYFTETWVVPSSSTPVKLSAVRTSPTPSPGVVFPMSQITAPTNCVALGGLPLYTTAGWTCTTAAGTGTVTSFSAPSASWPSWLVPLVTTSTTTPSLAVTASAIPNSALANDSMTINSTACTLGGSCTISSGGSMTWPSGSAGIPNYNGSSAWGTTYNASNTIPANFVSTLNQNTTGTAANITASSNATLTTLSSLSLPYSQLSATPALAQTIAVVSHEWLNSYTASTGAFTQSQPAFSDISGAVSNSQLANSSFTLGSTAISLGGTVTSVTGLDTTGTAANITATTNSTLTALSALSLPYSQLTGTPTLPANTAATTHEFFTAYDSTTGAFTEAQPSSSDVSGLGTFATQNYAAPPAIGGTTPAAATFTDLGVTGTPTFSGIEGAGTYCLQISSTGVLSNTGSACGSGSGGVTSFSGDGTLITNSNSAGAVTATLGNTGIGYGVWGGITSSSSAPAYHALSSYPPAAFPTLNQNTDGTSSNITATSNSTLTSLPNLALPYSQLSGTVPTWNQNTTGTAAGLTSQYIDWNASSGGSSIANKPVLATVATSGAYGDLTGTPTLPQNEAAVSNDFLTSYDSTTGAFSQARPTWANIDKTTSSLADLTTRTCSDLSDATVLCSTTPGTGVATWVATPTAANLASALGSQTQDYVFAAPSGSSGNATFRALVSSDIPDLSGTYQALGSRKWSCQTGLGDGTNAISAGTYYQSFCYNDTGSTVTLTGLKCFTDNDGSSTLNASGHTLGALLTGAITCSTSWASGTQSANVALTAGDYIEFTFVADGTSKQSTWEASGTY